MRNEKHGSLPSSCQVGLASILRLPEVILHCINRRKPSSSPTRSAVAAEAVAGFTRATDRPPIVMDTHFNPLATERCAR